MINIPSWAIAFALGLIGNLFFISVMKSIEVHGSPF